MTGELQRILGDRTARPSSYDGPGNERPSLRFLRITPARTWLLSVLLVPVVLVLFTRIARAADLPVPDGFLNILVPLVCAAAFVGCAVGIWRGSAHWSLKLLATIATPIALMLGVLIALAVLLGVHVQ